MAIEIEYNTRFGDTYSAAYTRILSININYVKNYADIIVGIYRSEIDRKEGRDPVSKESKIISGDIFDEFFKELALDNIDATINPVADIYSHLTKEEGGKYENGKKLYDEKTKPNGEIREVSKEEIIKDEKKALSENPM
jgi:hypothetical protein